MNGIVGKAGSDMKKSVTTGKSITPGFGLQYISDYTLYARRTLQKDVIAAGTKKAAHMPATGQKLAGEVRS